MINDTAYRLGSCRSLIRELFEYGKEAEKRVGKENVFDFSLGNPMTPPPDIINDRIAELVGSEPSVSLHGYTSANGSYEARCFVANDLARRFNADISPERIYMTCGAAASLSIAFHSIIASPNEEIIALAPYFPEYKVFVEGAGARLTVVPPDYNGFGINFSQLEAAINENTQAVIINSPNNPTGCIYSEEEIKRLSELLTECSKRLGHTIYIVSDEPYREIAYGFEVPFIPSIYPDTIICYSYSKSLSLAGERIGYIAVPNGVTEGNRLYLALCGAGRSLGYVCAPSLMQRVIASSDGVTCDISPYKKNRDFLYSSLEAIGYECVIPKGAFYLFIKSPSGDSLAFSELAKEKNLLIVPADGFGCPSYLRIAYCVAFDMLERSIPIFRELYSLCKRENQ